LWRTPAISFRASKTQDGPGYASKDEADLSLLGKEFRVLAYAKKITRGYKTTGYEAWKLQGPKGPLYLVRGDVDGSPWVNDFTQTPAEWAKNNNNPGRWTAPQLPTVYEVLPFEVVGVSLAGMTLDLCKRKK
jgi:hypothetical protein